MENAQVSEKTLTAWVASEDVPSDFIINEDDERVWEGAEPPRWPEEVERWRDRIKNGSVHSSVG